MWIRRVGPDLLGDDKTEGLVEQLYDTLYDYYMALDDEVLIFPGHGKGSPCGPEIGERLSSSIGYERKSNRFLQFDDLEAFKDSILSGQPMTPTHFPRMKEVNAKGPATWADLQPPGMGLSRKLKFKRSFVRTLVCCACHPQRDCADRVTSATQRDQVQSRI